MSFSENRMNRRSFLRAMGAGVVAGAMTPAILRGAEGNDRPYRMDGRKILIAHRGASSYAPQNTLEAYRLAIQQGADLVEQDLHVTKDGVLVCMHDFTLETTTDAAEVFPDRYEEQMEKGVAVKRWPIRNFTLAEIKQLRARSPRDNMRYTSVTVPTWQEAIDEIGSKAGLCPETKGPEVYPKYGYEIEKLVADVLKKNGLHQPGRGATPVLMQSFSEAGLGRMKKHGIEQPLMWLRGRNERQDPAAIFRQAVESGFAAVGPHKGNVTAEYVIAAHQAGLDVIPYTFEPRGLDKKFADLTAEMSHYLYDMDIDGLFTDNPDIFPRRAVR